MSRMSETELPSIEVARDVVALAAVEELCRAIHQIEPQRPVHMALRQLPALGLPDFPQAVVLLVIFNPASVAFLAELGKDVYRGFRAALFATYSRIVETKEQRLYSPLGLEYDRFVFAFEAGLTADDFERALADLNIQRASTDRGEYVYTFLTWDMQTRAWKRTGSGYFR